HPYAPPRIGLSLRLLSPAESIVVASVDGLWDARQRTTAEQARQYQQYVLASQFLWEKDAVLVAPNLYRQFVARHAVHALTMRNLPLAPPPEAPPQLPNDGDGHSHSDSSVAPPDIGSDLPQSQ